MRKIQYQPTNVVKQLWFYICILYIVLRSMVSILVVAYKVGNYYTQINLPFELLTFLVVAAFFLLLSLGHKVCYCEFDEDHVVRKNRIFRTSKSFDFADAKAVFFDKKGIKFYKNKGDITAKIPPLFTIPSYRDGKFQALDHKAFFDMMKEKEEEICDTDEFVVYRSYSVVPGYGQKAKMITFAYVCLSLLALINCATPLAVIIGLLQNFAQIINFNT